MTRKHFIAIADSLGLELKYAGTKESIAICSVITALIPTFKAANSNFNEQTFRNHIDAIANGTKAVTS